MVSKYEGWECNICGAVCDEKQDAEDCEKECKEMGIKPT